MGTPFEIGRSSRARRRLSLAADASEGFPQIFPALPALLKQPPPLLLPSHLDPAPSLAASATGSVNEAEDGRLFIRVCRHRFSIGASGSAGRRSRASPGGGGPSRRRRRVAPDLNPPGRCFPSPGSRGSVRGMLRRLSGGIWTRARSFSHLLLPK